RSRTSGEYLFVVLFMMLHPTHELEPPANPARFTSSPIPCPLILTSFCEESDTSALLTGDIIALRLKHTPV
ncbi:MAG: hypothetical protein ABJH45_22035, partial [Paracoccaceae bacterium]